MSELDYNVVLLTGGYTILGTIDLGDARLSDTLNDDTHSALRLREARVARLSAPTHILEQNGLAMICKDQIDLAFEPEPRLRSAKRLYGYVRKNAHRVVMLFDELQVRGLVHTTGGLELDDIHRFIALQSAKFLPVTDAVVSFTEDERFLIKPGAVIVNLQRLTYLGKTSQVASH